MIANRFFSVALLAMVLACPSMARANSTAAMMVGAVVLPPACVASTSTVNVAVKCASPYSFVKKVDNGAAIGPASTQVDTAGSNQPRLTVVY